MINKLALVVIASSLSTLSFACEKPEKPQLPNIESAVLAQMVKAQKDVNKYLKTSEAYLKCERNNNRHDKMIGEMKRLGATYNTLVKAYKGKSSSST
ncbi:MAG: hypothetical protein V7459_14050 [Oceanicoccus sp.]